VFARFLGLQYKVIYKKGSDNVAADAMSWCSHSDVLAVVLSVQHSWLSDEVTGYDSDLLAALALLSQLALQPDSWPPYTFVQGIIRYKGCIWLGTNKQVQAQVLQALHASPIEGHSGALVTYTRIKQLFF